MRIITEFDHHKTTLCLQHFIQYASNRLRWPTTPSYSLSNKTLYILQKHKFPIYPALIYLYTCSSSLIHTEQKTIAQFLQDLKTARSISQWTPQMFIRIQHGSLQLTWLISTCHNYLLSCIPIRQFICWTGSIVILIVVITCFMSNYYDSMIS